MRNFTHLGARVCYYSNPAKQELLNVKIETLQKEGAVSKAVAIEMAQGALKNSKAQVAIAITGIAGSDTNDKQNQGLVWLACVDFLGNNLVAKKIIAGTREEFIKMAIWESCQLLDQYQVRLKSKKKQ